MTDQWAEYLRFRDRFADVIDERFYPMAWVDEQVTNGNFVLLAQDESAILVSVKHYPSGLKEIHGECATGKLETIVSSLIPLAEQFGRALGCSYGSISSRSGWGKSMKSAGYDLHQAVIRKPL